MGDQRDRGRSEPRVGGQGLGLAEHLDEPAGAAQDRDEHERQQDVLLIDAWTGLRWSQLREMRVRDFVRVPMPVLLVSRAAPEGVEAKVTKSGKSRGMPIADRVLPLVRACADGKGSDEPLFTTRTGHQLHATSVKRAVHWSRIAQGRRIHDLRHTARACGCPAVSTR